MHEGMQPTDPTDEQVALDAAKDAARTNYEQHKADRAARQAQRDEQRKIKRAKLVAASKEAATKADADLLKLRHVEWLDSHAERSLRELAAAEEAIRALPSDATRRDIELAQIVAIRHERSKIVAESAERVATLRDQAVTSQQAATAIIHQIETLDEHLEGLDTYASGLYSSYALLSGFGALVRAPYPKAEVDTTSTAADPSTEGVP